MAMPEKYVFVCLNQRPEGHPKGSCLDRGAADVFNELREELVVPDNVWYGGVTETDVPALVEQHLIGGEPVEMLRIGPEDFTG